MFRRHRTKSIVAASAVVAGGLVYFFYRGPASDRRFLLGCLIVSGLFLAVMLALVRVLRCPRCGADMGYFQALRIIGRLRAYRPRYVICRDCGCVLDRHDDNRVVEGAIGRRTLWGNWVYFPRKDAAPQDDPEE